MNLPSMNTLWKIAAYTGVGGITVAVILQLKKQEQVSGSPYFREAFKVLRANEGDYFRIFNGIGKFLRNIFIFLGAKTLLGEPIKQLGFKASDPENFCDGKTAQFHVRVKGPKDKGKPLGQKFCV